MKNPFPTLGLGVLIGIGLLAPPIYADEAAAAQTAEMPAVPSLPTVTVVEVTTQVLTDRIIASGLIATVEEVQVVPLIEGQPVESLLVDVGDWVEAGQVLARLSTAALELQRAEAQAALASARAAVAQGKAQLTEAEAGAAEAERIITRTTTLKDKGTATQASWDAANAATIAAEARVLVSTELLAAAKAQLALAEARLGTAELYFARTEVKAPVAGVILGRSARVGAIATAAGQPMFILGRDGALELRAEVVEADVPRLVPHMPAALRVVGVDAPIEGSTRLVEPAIDPLTRLGLVRISIAASDAVRAGMFAEAEILVAEREGLTVPITALGSVDGAPSVMRVRDGMVEVALVTTGIRDGGMVEIIAGLAKGDLVVAKARAFVSQGDRVNPVLAN